MVNQAHVLECASKYKLSVELVEAIITVESSNNSNAIRFEPHYRYLWDVKNARPFRSLRPAELNSDRAPADFFSLVGSRSTEWVCQQMSWGPMQVMGGVARELGFAGWFPELCGRTGIEYGCKHLANLHGRFFVKHGTAGVIAAFNAGSPRYIEGKFVNQGYVDKVFKVMKEA